MKKNVSSQTIGVQLISTADGSNFTGSATVAITIDGGTQAAGAGAGPTHEGNGFHSYVPTQAETNGDHIAFTFSGTGAISATVQVYTTFPQSQDHTTPIDNIDTVVDLIKVDTTAILIDTGTTIPNQISGLNDISATDIVTNGAITTLSGAVVNVDTVDVTTTNTDMRGTDGANTTTPPTAAQITDAVWDEPTSGHTTAGTTGKALIDAGSAGDPWGTAVPGAYAVGTAGYILGTNLDTTVGSRLATSGYTAPDNAGIAANGVSISNLNDFNPVTDTVSNVTFVGTVNQNLDMRGTDNSLLAASYTAPDNAGITANGNAIAALNDLSAAQVNAEIVDVIFTDSTVEPTSVPLGTASIGAKISYTYSMATNKLTQTSTTQTIRDSADTVDIGTATVSDDGTTFTRGKVS